MARDTWGPKAPIVIGTYLGRTSENDLRTFRRQCSASGDADAQTLITLLRGPEGYIVLKRIMRDDPPDWWLELQRLHALAVLAEDFYARMVEAGR